MAGRGLVQMGLVLALVTMSWSGAMAQSGCTTALTNLSPCFNYVTGNSSTPSSPCCSQLATLVQSSPQCLCSLLNGRAPNLGININQTLALSLPGACNVRTPPVGQCNAAANGPTASAGSSPAGSPVSPPADGSGETPDDDGSISPSASGGSKTVPSAGTGDTSDASIVGARGPLALLLLVTTAASIVTKLF